MSTLGYGIYKTNQTNADDPRDVEYRLLAQVTTALLKARENPEDVKARVAAAMWNRDIWAALRQDLMNENNKLPQALRASLVSISLWVDKETMRLMDGSGDLEATIEINRNIMAGLKPESAADEAPPKAS
jgi:flagellar protein FlaF